jgi:hypothetical protein
MAAVWEISLSVSEKLILLAFADHADDSGFCYPSFERIGWKCGVSRDTVKRCMSKFKAAGLIEQLQEARGRGYPPRYRIRVERGGRLPPLPAREGGATGAKKGGQRKPERGAQLCPPNHHSEPSVNHQNPRAQSRRTRNLFDEEQEQRRRIAARDRRLLEEEAVARELQVGEGPEPIRSRVPR